ncbi:hypothetical protein HanHA89_Chr02g0057071 [Helianthus annuus]|nr:hypothetical protein HanHA89_Chr02g0057071 [Helianthus annuus]
MDLIYCLRDVDEDLAGDIVGECTRISSSFDVYQSQVHPKVKSKVLVGDKGLSKKVHDSILYFDVIF